MDIDDEKLIAEFSAPSKYTREQFMNKCPHVTPECEQELIWWEQWLEEHPDEKANQEIEYYKYLKERDVEYFMFKLRMRLFLEDNSIRGIGDFYLHVDGRNVTIRPVCPIGEVEPFTFKL